MKKTVKTILAVRLTSRSSDETGNWMISVPLIKCECSSNYVGKQNDQRNFFCLYSIVNHFGRCAEEWPVLFDTKLKSLKFWSFDGRLCCKIPTDLRLLINLGFKALTNEITANVAWINTRSTRGLITNMINYSPSPLTPLPPTMR